MKWHTRLAHVFKLNLLQMKNPFQLLSRQTLGKLGLLAGTVVLATACLPELDSADLPPAAFVSVYNGAPDAPGVQISANSNLVNPVPLNYSEWLAYSAFYPGKRDFRFASFNSATSLLEREFELKADTVYSVFLVEEVDGYEAILTQDQWEDPTAAEAQLRLVHLSPDAGAVSLEVSGSATPVLSQAEFKSISDFSSLSPGSTTLTIKTADGENLISTGTLELKGNRVYTLILRGLKSEASGSKKLDLQLITNYIDF